MALGHLLWVSWICFLLFDGSAGLPAIKGYGYPHSFDSHNIGDDGEDEVLTYPAFESNWQASNNQPTGTVYTSYNKPSVAQGPVSVPTQPKLPNKSRVSAVDRLINGGLRDWGLENLDKPLIFPLRPNYQLSDPAKPPLGPVQPQSTSLNVAASNSMYASPSAGGATHTSPTAVQHSGYAVADSGSVSPEYGSNTGSSAHAGNSRDIPHLVYENVFKYPSENTVPSPASHGSVSKTAWGYSQGPYMSKGSSTGHSSEPSFPSYPMNVGAQPVYASGDGSSSSLSSRGGNRDFGQTSYQLHNQPSSWQPEKTVVSTQKVSELIPPPSSYIVQSRDGYQRSRYLHTKSSYLPEFAPPMPVSSTGVKGPTSQPAAPKGVRNPQRTKW